MPIYRHDENIRSRAFEIQSKADADFCDLYAVLGLKAGASAKDIKTAYRALAKRYHPDRARSDPAADHKIKDINRAYAILSSPAARAAHDRRWAQLRASRPVRLWRRVAVLTATAAGMTALAAGIAVNLDYRLPPELHADSAGVSQIARSPQLDRRPRQASDDVAAMPEQPFGPGTPAPPPKSPAGEGLVPDAPVPSLVREPSMVREIGYFAADRIRHGKPAPAQTARSAETGESTPEPVAEPGGRDREHRARIEQQYREERTEERQQRSLAEQSRRDNERRAEIAQQQRDAQAAQRRRQALAAQQRRDQERREAAAQAQRERLAAEKQESMARARLEQRETERREEAKRQSAAQQQARTSETLPYSLGVNTGRRSSGASRWWPFENVSNAGGGGGGPGSSGSSGGGNSGSGSGGGGGGSGGSGSSGGGGSGSSGSGGSGGGGSGESGGGSGGSGGGGGGHGK